MRNKKIYLIVASFVLLLLFLVTENAVDLKICSGFSYACRANFDTYEKFLSPSIYLFFFSLFTYYLPSGVFSFWWRFARFGIPITFISLFLVRLYLESVSGGWVDLSGEVYFVVSTSIYILFALISLVQILRGWRYINSHKQEGLSVLEES